MVKRVGGREYVYYALESMLSYRSLVEKAKKLLSRFTVKLHDVQIPLSYMPYNVVSVDPSNRMVTFYWYTGFWDSLRPTRLYRITVNVGKETVEFRVEKSLEPNPRWPVNYLHRKEAFVEGLETLVINPYGNGCTLAWDSWKRVDKLVELPWVPVEVTAPDLDSLIEVLKKLRETLGNKPRIKLVAHVKPGLKTTVRISQCKV